MDPVFNFDVERAKEICKFIVQKNKNNISLHTEIRAELVDEELAGLFDKANIKYLEVGLQSSDPKVLRCVNRKTDIKRFVRGINFLKKYDLNAEVQLILGLPKDTLNSFKRSLEFVLSLEPKKLTVFPLQVLPGTEIWNKAARLGILYEEKPPYAFLQSKSLSFDDLVKLQKIINSLNLFRTKMTIKFLCKEAHLKLLDIIRIWIEWVNDDKFLLNPQNNEVLKDKFFKFIEYFCRQNNIDFNFYQTLLRKEVIFSMDEEKSQVSHAK